MSLCLRTPCRRRRPPTAARLLLEPLETRALLATTTWPGLVHPLPEVEPNGTLDQAQNLGSLSATGRAEVVGAIGNGVAGAADVDWYSFNLARAAHVTLATLDRQAGSPLVSVLSLYNNDAYDFNDPFDPLGYRQLAQDDGSLHGGDAYIDRLLGPGTYYVAVSGSGDLYFHPFLAGSGYPGSTGNYGLLITATNLGFNPTDGPVVLESDPAPGSALASAPFVIRLDLSAPLDPGTIVPGTNVQLIFNPTGAFGTNTDQNLLVGVNFSPDLTMGPQASTANELQLLPGAPLMPGYYEVFLAGNAGAGVQPLIGMNGAPLGATTTRPLGADFTTTFRISGVEGNTASGAASDDTAATAHQLGDVTNAGIVQRLEAIGDDPAYNPANADPLLSNPAADVDLYHFRVTGPGRYAFSAEVFAGRIGSPLDPGLSLFQLSATDQRLHLIDANDNTLNASPATNGTLPLYNDPVLYDGLTAGDYYLAVSGTGNVPDPAAGLLPGTNGIFDPNSSHSGQGGFTTGPYVLNLLVQPDNQPPQVIATTPAAGVTLAAPPTYVSVQFSVPVNLQQLAYQAGQQNQTAVNAIFVQGADGVQYYPRLESYDPLTNQATFLMLDALPNGINQLHLSGPLGLTDLAGNPLSRNDPSGDYVVRFTVNGPPRGTAGNPLLWSDQEPNNTFSQAQNLGVLFPHELQAGVQVVRDFSNSVASAPRDTADYFRFQVLQSRPYFFNLTGQGLPSTVSVTLFDAAGTSIPLLQLGGGNLFLASLDPGVYVVRIGKWTPAQAPKVVYQLRVTLGASVENPTPLTVGPAPVLHIRLASSPAPQPPPAPAPIVSLSPPPAPPKAADPALSTTAVASASTTIPSDVLAALAAGPVGGIQNPNTTVAQLVPGRLLVLATEPSLAAALLRVTVLTQTEESGSDQSSSLDLVKLLGGCAGNLAKFWQQSVHDIFSRGSWLLHGAQDWLEEIPMPTAEQDPQTQDAVPAIEPMSGDAPEAAIPSDQVQLSTITDEWFTYSPPWAWAGVLAALGALPVRNEDRRRPMPSSTFNV